MFLHTSDTMPFYLELITIRKNVLFSVDLNLPERAFLKFPRGRLKNEIKMIKKPFVLMKTDYTREINVLAEILEAMKPR